MSTSKRKWLLFSAFLGLVSLVGVGCRGFFVNPTLTSMTVTPASPNLQIGGTLQLIATGNNDDGSTKNLTTSSTWTTSDASKVTVSSTGLVKGIASTTGVTITATNGTVSGTDTVTVGQTTQTLSLSSSPSSPISLTIVGSNSTITFTATLNGSDVTNSTTFTSNNTSVISAPTGNTATIVGVGSATITATDNNNHTASITIQVTQ
ncbi:MAG TPA: Ig-like domain-containing protein [Terriglobales bacterium]|jgi:Big-like domain-containing protein|nr:Ig-like domain-containing protein [Terriglobales bacterium]